MVKHFPVGTKLWYQDPLGGKTTIVITKKPVKGYIQYKILSHSMSRYEGQYDCFGDDSVMAHMLNVITWPTELAEILYGD